ncbi:MAG: alginate lyase family protein [Gammaproteobacteria bacterium]|nr:alginate lyase family protein [Gammaproteobacteria bacterium]
MPNASFSAWMNSLIVSTLRIVRAVRRSIRLIRFSLWWLRDQLRSSYRCEGFARVSVARRTESFPIRLSAADSAALESIASHYLAHRFDILGSGWCVWNWQHEPMVNRANRRYAENLALSLSRDYARIDWHADRRSGYRFPCDRWSRLIQPGPRHGVDIKVPWELARMHHLVQLALLAVDDSTAPDLADACEIEIVDEIRDFVASNPPRFGVNWRVAMDVAIRAANWILAFSILEAHGSETSALNDLFEGALRDHGRYIVEHLEWDPHWRGNHYLANVCGLAFIAAALPAGTESNAWLALATGEVLAEGLRQVNADGSGFEGSTSYHRLSLDMLVNTIALLLGVDSRRWRAVTADNRLPRGLPQGFTPGGIDWVGLLDAEGHLCLPQALVARLWRAAGFTRAVSRPDGRALLIGDNDSGRFIKPCPRYEVLGADEARIRFPVRPVAAEADREWRELGEDHGHLVRAIEALFDVGADDSVDAWVIRWLASHRTLPVPCTPGTVGEDIGALAASAPAEQCNVLVLPFPRSIDTSRVALHAYPAWGLYLLKGDGLLLSFRCGPLGLSGTGNHDHNDQLGITFHLDGRDWIADPGTYRYTADLAERDAYRSVRAHFAPRLRDSDAEPGSLAEGTWRLGDQAQAKIEQATASSLQGRHQGYGGVVHRRVELFEDRLLIRDWSDDGLDLMPLVEQYAGLNADGSALPYCPDYGVRCA